MIKKLILTFLLVLGGCTDGAPPQNWTTPTSNSSLKKVYLQANNKDWTRGVAYNQNYKYTISINAQNPGFNSSADRNKAIATGTIRFSNWNSCPSCTAINGNPLYGYGAIEYKLTTDDVPPRSEDNGTQITDKTCIGKCDATGVSGEPNVLSGYIWLRIFDRTGTYGDNSGQYEVTIEYPIDDSSFIATLATYLINPIQDQVKLVSKGFWENIVNNSTTKTVIFTMMTLYIIILGIYFIFGFVEMTQKEFITRIVKIGVVSALLTGSSSYDFFNIHLLNLFVDGQTYLINSVNNAKDLYSTTVDYNAAFRFTNIVLNTIFSAQFLSIAGSFILWFPIGWLCFCLILLGVIEYTIAVLEAVILYLIATTSVQFLICFGPIFISLILFEKTKGLFETWIKTIISFAMQPIILFASIMLINVLIAGSVNNLINVKFGWECVKYFYINVFGVTKVDLRCMHWYVPIAGDMLDMIRDCLVFYLLITFIRKITGVATSVTSTIFGGGDALSAGANMAASVGTTIRSALSKAANSKALPEPDKDDKEPKASVSRDSGPRGSDNSTTTGGTPSSGGASGLSGGGSPSPAGRSGLAAGGNLPPTGGTP